MKKKIAVIGCGRISGHHCKAIKKTQNLQLSAVCDLDEEKAKKYGKEFNILHFCNYHQMLSDIKDIDIVVIATPSGMHFEHSLEILQKYNKSIIVEKPTFMKPSQVRKAYKVANDLNLKIYPIFQNRYNKAVQRVKDALNSNEIGSIRTINVRLRWSRPQRYYDMSDWRGTYSHDGGALTNQGIHHIDLLRYLGGEIKELNATMRTLGANIEVEDTVVATFSYQNNSIGSLEVTTAARPHDYEASISIVGSKGLAQIGGIAVNELQIFTPDPGSCSEFSEDFSNNVYGNGHEVLYNEISNSQTKSKPFLIDEEDCYRSIQLLHAFYVSDEIKNWYHVNNDRESKRLGKPNDTISNLYRVKF